jgi:hypothetical protein
VNLGVAIAPRALVPSVIGLTQAVATASITGAGLVVGAVTTAVSAIFAPGTVISQDPVGGNKVPVGTAVDLVVTLTSVPNVVGLTQAAATTAILRANLVVGTVTLQSSATVPAGSVISQSPTAGTSVTGGSAVNLVVSNGTAPTIAGTFIRNAGAPNLTVTSPAFTTTANTLIVAFVSADGPVDAPNTIVNRMANTGIPLTWTRAVRSNVQLGTAEIWWAFTPTARTLTTATAVLNNSEPASMTVMTFTGAAPSLVGAASVAASAPSGQPSASLVTTRGNSLVLAVGTDWDSPRIMTAPAGQTIVNQFRPPVGDTYWVQRTANPVTAAGTAVTISDTYGASMPDRWNMALIEIRRP